MFARLACIRHAASVRPEPGSNSPIRLFDLLNCCLFKKRLKFKTLTFLLCLVFKEQSVVIIKTTAQLLYHLTFWKSTSFFFLFSKKVIVSLQNLSCLSDIN